MGEATTGSIESSLKPKSAICRISLEKIRVVMGVGAPHIIILLAPAAGHLQETGNNQFIAAAAVSGFAQPVVHFRAAVHAEDHIAHFFIAENP